MNPPLKRLAINEEGFVFDPATGISFTTNSSGLMILKALRDNKSPEAIAAELQAAFEMTPEAVERDVIDFIAHLKTYKLLE